MRTEKISRSLYRRWRLKAHLKALHSVRPSVHSCLVKDFRQNKSLRRSTKEPRCSSGLGLIWVWEYQRRLNLAFLGSMTIPQQRCAICSITYATQEKRDIIMSIFSNSGWASWKVVLRKIFSFSLRWNLCDIFSDSHHKNTIYCTLLVESGRRHRFQ